MKSLRRLVEKRKRRIRGWKTYDLLVDAGHLKPYTEVLLERKAMAQYAQAYRKESVHK